MKKLLKWLDNYWYHYKWQTIIAAFFIVVVGVCGTQMLNRTEYDAYLLYAGGGYFTVDEEQAMLNAFSNAAGDYDGSGSTKLCMIPLVILSEDELAEARAKAEAEGEQLAYNYDTRTETLRQLDMEIMTGNAYVCLLSESMYVRCADKDRFVSVLDALGYTPEGLYDDYTVRLSETEFGKYFSDALAPLGEDTLLCFRQISITDAQNKNAAADYENDKEFFRGIVEFSVKE